MYAYIAYICKIEAYSKSWKPGVVFKGKKEKDFIRCFDIVIQAIMVNVRSRVSLWLNRQLLSKCPCNTVFA
jgi:hypothetical protein